MFRGLRLFGLALVVGAGCTSFGADDGDRGDASPDGAVVVEGGADPADASAADVAMDAPAPRAWKAIFVSRGTTTGDLGLAAEAFGRADAICQGEARDAGLPGTFVALVRPGPNGSIVDRANVGNGESVERFVPRSGGGQGRLAIRLGTPFVPLGVRIGAYADGAEVVEQVLVWTGGIGPQSPEGTCRSGANQDWRDATEDGAGLIGDPRQNGREVLELAGNADCSSDHNLYCVER